MTNRRFHLTIHNGINFFIVEYKFASIFGKDDDIVVISDKEERELYNWVKDTHKDQFSKKHQYFQFSDDYRFACFKFPLTLEQYIEYKLLFGKKYAY